MAMKKEESKLNVGSMTRRGIYVDTSSKDLYFVHSAHTMTF